MVLKKLYITLLEIMIIFAILAAAGGAIAFNIRKFYLQQQVLNDVNKVVNVLNTASELMMIASLDSEVRFSVEEGKIQIRIAPQSGVTATIRPLLTKEPITLSHLDHMVFKDGVQQTTLTPPFSLVFESKGFLMNRGILHLEGQGHERYLLFKGYPSPFLPLSGDEDYQEGSFRVMVEKMTEQVKSATAS